MTPDRARPSMRLPRRRCGRSVAARHRRVLAAILVGVAAAGLPSPVVASSGGGRRITDAENTRTVYLVVTVLILLAAGLAVFTWWFWRSTRREHEALAPLEVMGDRKFRAVDPITRQTLLDGSRPVGAAPLAPGAAEPLLVVPDGDDAAAAGPATLVIAAVGEASEGSTIVGDEPVTITGRTEAPTTNGDAAAAPPVEAVDEHAGGAEESDGESATADAEAAVSASERADEPADADTGGRAAGAGNGDATMAIDIAAPVGADVAKLDHANGAAGAHTGNGDGDATMAVDVVGAVPESLVGTTTPAPDDDIEPPASSNGSAAAPTPIDPGLPVPPAAEEPVRHLSLAELVALHPGAPIGFDDSELASTPSTGIPVIESAEAWVERQLAASGADPATPAVEDRSSDDAAAEDASGDSAAAASDGDDPDESTRAPVGSAE